MPRRRSRFGRTSGPKPAVKQSNLRQRRRGACKGCGMTIEAGDPIVKLTLRKVHRVPCVTCSHVPVGTKRYHPGCVPSDINKAMGYDPLARARQAAHQHTAPTPSVTAAPPPKPQSTADAQLAALLALEHALMLKLKNDPNAWTIKPVNGLPKRVLKDEIESEFKTIQGIKARAVRPGTEAEGAVAMKMAFTRLLKLAY
jgi:hypothetical protein